MFNRAKTLVALATLGACLNGCMSMTHDVAEFAGIHLPPALVTKGSKFGVSIGDSRASANATILRKENWKFGGTIDCASNPVYAQQDSDCAYADKVDTYARDLGAYDVWIGVGIRDGHVVTISWGDTVNIS